MKLFLTLLLALAVQRAAAQPAATAPDEIDLEEVYGAVLATPECLDAAAGGALRACIRAVRDSVNAELDRVYHEALAAATRSAAEGGERLKGLPGTLRASQRTWEAQREAECAAFMRGFQSSNIAEINANHCAMAKARMRTAELRFLYLGGYERVVLMGG